ncbi:M3 family metallopeptidase [Georgenia yuyongxinii]|uniref:M3 family metallopeptidase n=1 Tax=Georgenia yuyongxinii TaxID=2589797 RepID=A0A552WTP0_9MICO|nr:M3 family metallopeptidase [Georgenia yuyongxinii]TRW46218.1 M3 family metallopeptidase [Georgenia yuyongxinii]
MPAETVATFEPAGGAALDASNPFAAPSALPYGLPDFAAVGVEHLRPAVAAGMAAQRAEWEAVATDERMPDVANTLEAIERSGTLLRRVMTVFHTLASSVGGDEIHAVETEVAPRLAAHGDTFWLDRRIFDRLESLANAAPLLDLDAETAWLLHTYRKNFQRAGIRLADAQHEQLRALNGRIVTLETEFSQRVVKAMEVGVVRVEDPAELAGLDEGTVAALARNAADRAGSTLAMPGGGHLVPLMLPTQQPLLARASHRGLRARLLEASVTRGTGVDAASDTRAVLLELARLRAERAQLLGYAHHAAYVVEDGTAASADVVGEMLARLAAPAARNATREAAELQEVLDADPTVPDGTRLAPSDWTYYAERLRKERLSFDDTVLRPYLELDRVLTEGVFYTAGKLFGLTFHERDDLAGYADDVRVWEVLEADGTGVGLFVGDFYARPGKRGGAWMHNLVDQSHLLGQRPVVVNNLNITPPPPGMPTLLTWDEVRTCFHEFGHALHGLFSDVRYPSLSGTSVPRDFVEYPSQVNEMWMAHPDVVARFARHHVTGEPLPAELLDKVLSAGTYGQGFATTEYLGAALLDQAWHQVGPDQVPTEPTEVEAFEREALDRAGVGLELVPPRYRSTYFNHTFGGGYDAGYYSYIWSEVLDADTVEWFAEQAQDGDGGLNRAAGTRFREALLSRGYSQDPLASFRELRGRDAVIDPLLVRRGLTD